MFTCLFILSFVTFKDSVKIMQIFSDDIEVDQANPGENLKLKVTGVEEEVKFMRYHEFKWSWKLFTVFSLIWEIIFPLFLLTIYKYMLIVSVQMLHFEKALQVLVNLQVWWEGRLSVRKGNSENMSTIGHNLCLSKYNY